MGKFRDRFESDILINGRLAVKTILREYGLPKRFIDKIFEINGSDDTVLCSQLNKETRKNLIQLLSDHPMKVVDFGDFNISMATMGGISIQEIDSKTMGSKLIDGLYFAGEIIDIDGDTGGYNIQAAFSTGRLAANSINKKEA
jgi:predicted flavoprotein YhiN